MNVRFATQQGYDYLLTVRSFKEEGAGSALLATIPTIEGKLAELECKPIFGKGSKAAAQETAPGEDPAEKPCPIHDVMMKRRSGATGTWYSHKLADGSWCNGGEKK